MHVDSEMRFNAFSADATAWLGSLQLVLSAAQHDIKSECP